MTTLSRLSHTLHGHSTGKRDAGNSLFVAQKYKSARKVYQQGLDALVGLVAGSSEALSDAAASSSAVAVLRCLVSIRSK